MNLTQMHERLRLELLRRIQRGTLSVSLLARQSGFGQAHLSNFLHGRRQLSLEAIDRILVSQHLSASDLLPDPRGTSALPADAEEEVTAIPVVTHTAALFEPHIRPSAVQWMLPLRDKDLTHWRTRVSYPRRGWQRFVAIVISAQESLPMEPLLLPEAIVIIDRHYNSLMSYRSDRPNLFAVRSGNHLLIRYTDFQSGRLVLRPHNRDYPVELLEVADDDSPSDLVIGRVGWIRNEL